jgi:hypothetical protein
MVGPVVVMCVIYAAPLAVTLCVLALLLRDGKKMVCRLK